MWTENKIKIYLINLGEKFGMDLTSIPVEINKKMIKCWGKYVYDSVTLEPMKFVFSYYLLDGSYDENQITGIIKHEFAHFYTNTKYKKACGHGLEFKETCRLLNIPYTDISDLKISDPLKQYVDNLNKKYKITCLSCGNVFYKKKLPNYCTLQTYSLNYKCKCKGHLQIEQLH